MTRYTVLWDQDVESQFIRAWVASDSSTRSVLTEVANWVDSSLAADPDQQGRPLDALDARMALVPLTSSTARVVVTFQVNQEDRVVRVVRMTFSR